MDNKNPGGCKPQLLWLETKEETASTGHFEPELARLLEVPGGHPLPRQRPPDRPRQPPARPATVPRLVAPPPVRDRARRQTTAVKVNQTLHGGAPVPSASTAWERHLLKGPPSSPTSNHHPAPPALSTPPKWPK
ncbi:hypothetical protein PG997_008874 [Apiospora hydei]|uniref:Uncharacterized protein n=1 Tax=Apiospora hydei TaxID=1337664 RepID=A0ABR1WC31_9PEZI